MGWLPIAGYVVAYDWWAITTGRPTLSQQARRLDGLPPVRVLAVAVGLALVNHLVGTRRPW